MIRDHSHHLTKSTVKETTFDRLPRSPRDPMLEAERQGFDDGYFGNERFYAGKREEADLYSKAYNEGEDQRRCIDSRKKKK